MTVEYHLLDGHYDRLPSLMADLVRRRVAVFATPGGNPTSQAAKAASTTIPIVFGVGTDPVKLGLVASLARSSGNATGVNFFTQEITAKRLALLHELAPKAVVRLARREKTKEERGHGFTLTLLSKMEAMRPVVLSFPPKLHVLHPSTNMVHQTRDQFSSPNAFA